LPCISNTVKAARFVAEKYRPQFNQNVTEIRMVMGYQYDQFETDQLDNFFAAEYTISQHSNRMGYRLEGPQISHSNKQMLSEGICLGAIQLPPDGQPIILLCDRQTIGGYPKVGSVFSQDIAKLAQLMPGRKIRFEAIDIEQAQILLRGVEQ
jgi:allophanate hydrolase subunit 2